MKYRMINKRERSAREELKEYTLGELKAYFEPNKEDFPQEWEKWNEIADLIDLEAFLKEEADGMEVPYTFEKV